MAVSSAVSTALLDAGKDGAAIAALGLGVLVAIAGFKYARRAVSSKDSAPEKGLFIEERDPELLALVEDYADERNAQVGSHESDGTYEHYYRNREAFDDIAEFLAEGRHEAFEDESADDDPDESDEDSFDAGQAANDDIAAAESEGFDDEDEDEDDEFAESGELARSAQS
ncbi:MAG: major capsid protein [Methylococcus sp.]|nr:major capsid protein [Methylococcus sp.]